MAQALEIPLLTIVAPQGHLNIANPHDHPRFQAIECCCTNNEVEISAVNTKLEKLIAALWN
jgi:heptosyltransferase-2